MSVAFISIAIILQILINSVCNQKDYKSKFFYISEIKSAFWRFTSTTKLEGTVVSLVASPRSIK